MAFEKIVLLSGVNRLDYIRQRLGDGADAPAILAEINGPLLFSGAAGKPWPATIVYAEQRRLREIAEKLTKVGRPATKKIDPLLGAAHPAPRAARAPVEDEDDLKETGGIEAQAEVPPEYEGILTAADVAEIQEEAAASIRKEQRKQARASLLAKAKADLAAQAKLALQQGHARGDMVDVYLDLAPYAADIRLDGHVFSHGRTHRVARPVAAVLYDIMQRSWQHQESISGQRNDFNRKRNIEVSAKRGVLGAEGLRA